MSSVTIYYSPFHMSVLFLIFKFPATNGLARSLVVARVATYSRTLVQEAGYSINMKESRTFDAKLQR